MEYLVNDTIGIINNFYIFISGRDNAHFRQYFLVQGEKKLFGGLAKKIARLVA
jgi:hypothetical protein